MFMLSILILICFLLMNSFHAIEYPIIEYKRIYIEYGNNIGSHVAMQIEKHFHKVKINSNSDIDIFDYSQVATGIHNPMTPSKERIKHNLYFSREDTLILSFGNGKLSQTIISQEQLDALPPESFIVKSSTYRDAYVLVCNGNPLGPTIGLNSTLDRELLHYGAIVGSYHILELLGFAFLHPLEPLRPNNIQIHSDVITNPIFVRHSPSHPPIIDIVESPHWPQRMFHLHTQ